MKASKEFKKSLAVYKRQSARSVKYAGSEFYKKFSVSYREALNFITNESQLIDLISYKRIFSDAYRNNEISVMLAVIENINFEFNK